MGINIHIDKQDAAEATDNWNYLNIVASLEIQFVAGKLSFRSSQCMWGGGPTFLVSQKDSRSHVDEIIRLLTCLFKDVLNIIEDKLVNS